MGRERIDFERLADLAEGRLPDEEASALAENLATADEETRRDAEWLRAFAAASEGVVLASPPPEMRAESMRRFEAFAGGRRSPGFFERLVASLTFEGGLRPAFGVRSAGGQEEPRQLVYSTDIADIVVNHRRRTGGSGLDLNGQILLAGGDEMPANFGVQLLRGATEAGMTSTDDLGEFAFEAVPPGEYQILLSGERVEILISPVQLGA